MVLGSFKGKSRGGPTSFLGQFWEYFQLFLNYFEAILGYFGASLGYFGVPGGPGWYYHDPFFKGNPGVVLCSFILPGIQEDPGGQGGGARKGYFGLF